MMYSFTQILLGVPPTTSAYSIRNRSRDATPFKVQVKFDIPLFEGKIIADALDNWLNVLEGYFFVHNFFNGENITFALLKAPPSSKKMVGYLL